MIKTVNANITCSADLDKSYEKKEPNNFRWDYFLEVFYQGRNIALFMEPHTCTSDEVKCVISKFNWLIDKIRNNLSFLKLQTSKQLYYWVQSSDYKIPPHTRQYKMLIKTPIKTVKYIFDRNLI